MLLYFPPYSPDLNLIEKSFSICMCRSNSNTITVCSMFYREGIPTTQWHHFPWSWRSDCYTSRFMWLCDSRDGRALVSACRIHKHSSVKKLYLIAFGSKITFVLLDNMEWRWKSQSGQKWIHKHAVRPFLTSTKPRNPAKHHWEMYDVFRASGSTITWKILLGPANPPFPIYLLHRRGNTLAFPIARGLLVK